MCRSWCSCCYSERRCSKTALSCFVFCRCWCPCCYFNRRCSWGVKSPLAIVVFLSCVCVLSLQDVQQRQQQQITAEAEPAATICEASYRRLSERFKENHKDEKGIPPLSFTPMAPAIAAAVTAGARVPEVHRSAAGAAAQNRCRLLVPSKPHTHVQRHRQLAHLQQHQQQKKHLGHRMQLQHHQSQHTGKREFIEQQHNNEGRLKLPQQLLLLHYASQQWRRGASPDTQRKRRSFTEIPRERQQQQHNCSQLQEHQQQPNDRQQQQPSDWQQQQPNDWQQQQPNDWQQQQQNQDHQETLLQHFRRKRRQQRHHCTPQHQQQQQYEQEQLRLEEHANQHQQQQQQQQQHQEQDGQQQQELHQHQLQHGGPHQQQQHQQQQYQQQQRMRQPQHAHQQQQRHLSLVTGPPERQQQQHIQQKKRQLQRERIGPHLRQQLSTGGGVCCSNILLKSPHTTNQTEPCYKPSIPYSLLFSSLHLSSSFKFSARGGLNHISPHPISLTLSSPSSSSSSSSSSFSSFPSCPIFPCYFSSSVHRCSLLSSFLPSTFFSSFLHFPTSSCGHSSSPSCTSWASFSPFFAALSCPHYCAHPLCSAHQRTFSTSCFSSSSSSSSAELQRLFQREIREWFVQKKQGTHWHLWYPPGILFSNTRHQKRGVVTPPLCQWYFPSISSISSPDDDDDEYLSSFSSSSPSPDDGAYLSPSERDLFSPFSLSVSNPSLFSATGTPFSTEKAEASCFTGKERSTQSSSPDTGVSHVFRPSSVSDCTSSFSPSSSSSSSSPFSSSSFSSSSSFLSSPFSSTTSSYSSRPPATTTTTTTSTSVFPPFSSSSSTTTLCVPSCVVSFLSHSKASVAFLVQQILLHPQTFYVAVAPDYDICYVLLRLATRSVSAGLLSVRGISSSEYYVCRAFGMTPWKLSLFPNLRILCTHPLHVPAFIPNDLLSEVYVHLTDVQGAVRRCCTSRCPLLSSTFLPRLHAKLQSHSNVYILIETPSSSSPTASPSSLISLQKQPDNTRSRISEPSSSLVQSISMPPTTSLSSVKRRVNKEAIDVSKRFTEMKTTGDGGVSQHNEKTDEENDAKEKTAINLLMQLLQQTPAATSLRDFRDTPAKRKRAEAFAAAAVSVGSSSIHTSAAGTYSKLPGAAVASAESSGATTAAAAAAKGTENRSSATNLLQLLLPSQWEGCCVKLEQTAAAAAAAAVGACMTTEPPRQQRDFFLSGQQRRRRADLLYALETGEDSCFSLYLAQLLQLSQQRQSKHQRQQQRRHSEESVYKQQAAQLQQKKGKLLLQDVRMKQEGGHLLQKELLQQEEQRLLHKHEQAVTLPQLQVQTVVAGCDHGREEEEEKEEKEEEEEEEEGETSLQRQQRDYVEEELQAEHEENLQNSQEGWMGIGPLKSFSSILRNELQQLLRERETVVQPYMEKQVKQRQQPQQQHEADIFVRTCSLKNSGRECQGGLHRTHRFRQVDGGGGSKAGEQEDDDEDRGGKHIEAEEDPSNTGQLRLLRKGEHVNSPRGAEGESKTTHRHGPAPHIENGAAMTNRRQQHRLSRYRWRRPAAAICRDNFSRFYRKKKRNISMQKREEEMICMQREEDTCKQRKEENDTKQEEDTCMHTGVSVASSNQRSRTHMRLQNKRTNDFCCRRTVGCRSENSDDVNQNVACTDPLVVLKTTHRRRRSSYRERKRLQRNTIVRTSVLSECLCAARKRSSGVWGRGHPSSDHRASLQRVCDDYSFDKEKESKRTCRIETGSPKKAKVFLPVERRGDCRPEREEEGVASVDTSLSEYSSTQERKNTVENEEEEEGEERHFEGMQGKMFLIADENLAGGGSSLQQNKSSRHRSQCVPPVHAAGEGAETYYANTSENENEEAAPRRFVETSSNFVQVLEERNASYDEEREEDTQQISNTQSNGGDNEDGLHIAASVRRSTEGGDALTLPSGGLVVFHEPDKEEGTTSSSSFFSFDSSSSSSSSSFHSKLKYRQANHRNNLVLQQRQEVAAQQQQQPEEGQQQHQSAAGKAEVYGHRSKASGRSSVANTYAGSNNSSSSSTRGRRVRDSGHTDAKSSSKNNANISSSCSSSFTWMKLRKLEPQLPNFRFLLYRV